MKLGVLKSVCLAFIDLHVPLIFFYMRANKLNLNASNYLKELLKEKRNAREINETLQSIWFQFAYFYTWIVSMKILWGNWNKKGFKIKRRLKICRNSLRIRECIRIIWSKNDHILNYKLNDGCNFIGDSTHSLSTTWIKNTGRVLTLQLILYKKIKLGLV